MRSEKKLEGRSSYQQQSALTAALGQDHLAVALLLMDKGYRPDAQDFCTACRRGHLQLLPGLVAAGADVSQPDKHQTPLAAAASCGQLAVLEWLKAHDAAVSSQVSVALSYAANSGHAEVIRWLVSHGSDLDVQTSYGWTPLMSAAWQGNSDAVVALLQLGANDAIVDNQGKTALDWANEGKRDEVVRVLTAGRP